MFITNDARNMALTFAKGYELPEVDVKVLRNFVPEDRTAYEIFKSRGVAPAGYMSCEMVASVCPSCGEEMRKADLPLIAEDYFVQLIGQRVAGDIFNNTEKWAKAVQDEDGLLDILKGLVDDADDYDFEKAKAGLTQKTVSDKADKADMPQILDGDALDLVDFLKANPSSAIQGWAAKMKKEGGEHPFTWCKGKAEAFSSDPDAFCAAVHLAAYGKTPMQRKTEKKLV